MKSMDGMKGERQLKVQAYLDNELSPGDARKVAQMISSDAEARDLFTELKETKEILAQNEPVVKLEESRDFYWSKIQRGIASAEREAAARPARPWWMPFLAPMAGAVALCVVLLSIMDRGTGTPLAVTQGMDPVAAPLHELEQSAEVSTITFRSDTEGVTVVWLSSLQ
jgi:anti-sigma factor RsiW